MAHNPNERCEREVLSCPDSEFHNLGASTEKAYLHATILLTWDKGALEGEPPQIPKSMGITWTSNNLNPNYEGLSGLIYSSIIKIHITTDTYKSYRE